MVVVTHEGPVLRARLQTVFPVFMEEARIIEEGRPEEIDGQFRATNALESFLRMVTGDGLTCILLAIACRATAGIPAAWRVLPARRAFAGAAAVSRLAAAKPPSAGGLERGANRALPTRRPLAVARPRAKVDGPVS